MRKTRGYALMVALAALVAIFAAAMLLSRGVLERIQTERAASRRESALRQAEGRLERARLALANGQLHPGGTFNADGGQVSCQATATGVRLEALALCTQAEPGALPNKAAVARAPARAQLRRGVRVRWEMERGTGTAGEWKRVAWSARNETLQP